MGQSGSQAEKPEIPIPIPTRLQAKKINPTLGTLEIHFSIFSPGTDLKQFYSQLRETHMYSEHAYIAQAPPEQLFLEVTNLQKSFAYSFQAQLVSMANPNRTSAWSAPLIIKLDDDLSSTSRETSISLYLVECPVHTTWPFGGTDDDDCLAWCSSARVLFMLELFRCV